MRPRENAAIIKAWADGVPIEFRLKQEDIEPEMNEWFPYSDEEHAQFPVGDCDMEWRVDLSYKYRVENSFQLVGKYYDLYMLWKNRANKACDKCGHQPEEQQSGS